MFNINGDNKARNLRIIVCYDEPQPLVTEFTFGSDAAGTDGGTSEIPLGGVDPATTVTMQVIDLKACCGASIVGITFPATPASVVTVHYNHDGTTGFAGLNDGVFASCSKACAPGFDSGITSPGGDSGPADPEAEDTDNGETPAGEFSGNAAANDTPCSDGETCFELVAGSEVGPRFQCRHGRRWFVHCGHYRPRRLGILVQHALRWRGRHEGDCWDGEGSSALVRLQPPMLSTLTTATRHPVNSRVMRRRMILLARMARHALNWSRDRKSTSRMS